MEGNQVLLTQHLGAASKYLWAYSMLTQGLRCIIPLGTISPEIGQLTNLALFTFSVRLYRGWWVGNLPGVRGGALLSKETAPYAFS